MGLQTTINQRDFSVSLVNPPVDYSLEWFTNNAIGGPDRAFIRATGPEAAVWELVERLRCPVELFDPEVGLVWWGYVSGVTIKVGEVIVGVTLDQMFNRVATAYAEIAEGESGSGERGTTAYATDAESIAEYGSRDLLVRLDAATTTAAEAARDTQLARYKLPIPKIQRGQGQGADLVAEIDCKGWWNTLTWRQYTNAATTEIATTTQISTAVASLGEFITGVEINTASGINTNQFRDGDLSLQSVIIELLKIGTTSDRRLLARVTPERALIIEEEPDVAASPHLLTRQNQIADALGNPLRPELAPVGIWAQLIDVIPASVNASKLADPSLLFIEANTYDARRREMIPEGRDNPSPWDFTDIGIGDVI